MGFFQRFFGAKEKKSQKPNLKKEVLNDDDEIYSKILNHFDGKPAEFGSWLVKTFTDEKNGFFLLQLGLIFSTLAEKSSNPSYLSLAFICWEKALQQFKQGSDTLGIGSCYNNLGSIYATWNNLDKAIDFKQKAFDIYKNFKNEHEKDFFLAIEKDLCNLKTIASNDKLKMHTEFRTINSIPEGKLSIKLILDECNPPEPFTFSVVIG